VIREEAGLIDVPIYFCNGERDVSPDLHAEPSYFRACTDFTLQCLPHSAHCHNFASTRHVLWDRMHRWSHKLLPRGGRVAAMAKALPPQSR
jgi:hypothetical protein